MGWAKPKTVGFSVKISLRNQRNSGWGGKLETVGFSIEILSKIIGFLVGVCQARKRRIFNCNIIRNQRKSGWGEPSEELSRSDCGDSLKSARRNEVNLSKPATGATGAPQARINKYIYIYIYVICTGRL